MLTGDENIVDVNFTVGWVIKDAADYLFNVDSQEQTIKAVAESAMREIVGQTQIQRILTQDRAPIEIQVRELMQKTLDSYRAGVTITQVKMQKADTPAEVIDAYRDAELPLFFILHTDPDPGFGPDSPHFRLMDFITRREDEPWHARAFACAVARACFLRAVP